MKTSKIFITSILTGMLILGGCSSVKTGSSTSEPTASSSSSAPVTNGNTASSSSVSPSQSAGATTANSSTSAASSDSGLTQQTTQGPYYVTGTSQLVNGNLNPENLPGQRIKVSGYVYAGATGTAPIAGAKIEVWQADDSGSYHPNNNGSATKYSSDQVSLRGYVSTDEKGYYEYTTIYPGEYTGRTRHIHTNTTATGYKGVITQLIIPSLNGDKTTASKDNIASSLPASNQVTFTTIDGIPSATFNYRLAAN